MKISNQAKSEILGSLLDSGSEFLMIVDLLSPTADVHLKNFWDQPTIPLKVNHNAVKIISLDNEYFVFLTSFRGIQTTVYLAIEDILILKTGDQQMVFSGSASDYAPPPQPNKPQLRLVASNPQIEQTAPRGELRLV